MATGEHLWTKLAFGIDNRYRAWRVLGDDLLFFNKKLGGFGGGQILVVGATTPPYLANARAPRPPINQLGWDNWGGGVRRPLPPKFLTCATMVNFLCIVGLVMLFLIRQVFRLSKWTFLKVFWTLFAPLPKIGEPWPHNCCFFEGKKTQKTWKKTKGFSWKNSL